MTLLFEVWGTFMPYVFVLGIFRILTSLVWRAFTRGEF